MINSYKCNTSGGNTGIGDCPFDPAKIVGFFLVGENFVLTEANLVSDTNVIAALTAAASADLKSARLFPVHDLLDITDNTADASEQTFGYGPSVIVSDGYYNWTFPYIQGGICLQKELQKFNGSSIRVIFYDEDWNLIGWRVGNEMYGIPLNQFYANPWRPATGAAVVQKTVRFSFAPRYINQEIGFYKLEQTNPAIVKGLRNVAIKLFSAAKPVYKVQLFTGCSASNLFDSFPTEFAEVGLWKATNASTGALITITSVAADPNISGFTITLDSTDADYPAAGTINLTLASPSVLKAAGIIGYEGLTLAIVNV